MPLCGNALWFEYAEQYRYLGNVDTHTRCEHETWRQYVISLFLVHTAICVERLGFGYLFIAPPPPLRASNRATWCNHLLVRYPQTLSNIGAAGAAAPPPTAAATAAASAASAAAAVAAAAEAAAGGTGLNADEASAVMEDKDAEDVVRVAAAIK